MMEYEIYWDEDAREYVALDNLGAEIPLYVDTLADAQQAAAKVFHVTPAQIVEAGALPTDEDF